MKTLKRDKVVLDFRESERERIGLLSGTYPHVVEDKIYWQLAEPTEISVAIKDGNSYSKNKNSVISNSLSSANFRVFIDTNPDTPEDERYKAVGGYHVGRDSVPTKFGHHNASLHKQLSGCEVSKTLEVIPVKDSIWPDFIKLLFKDDFFHPRHANGLYIFKSSDGINWTEYYDKPIFSCFTECEDSELSLDTMPTIFYDHNINEYVIYLRSNIKLGVRHVLYSKSKDLITWSKPILIETTPPFDMNNENLYYMGAYPFGKKYIAFPPHFKNEIISDTNRLYSDAKTKVMISDDGIKWKTVDEILQSNTTGHMTQSHVVSFKEEDGEYIIYVHEGYLTYDGKLVSYTIDKKELEYIVNG